MQRLEVTKSVETLLAELHEKKRWLDMMINGLEAAVSSPEHQLITSVEEAFDGPAPKAARAELRRDHRAALATLAQSVNATPHARRKRSLSWGHEART